MRTERGTALWQIVVVVREDGRRPAVSPTRIALLGGIDRLDRWLRARGFSISCPAAWSLVTSGEVSKLYAGKLYRWHPQYRTCLGLTPFEPSARNIAHDVRHRMPVPDSSVESYQSEDVFEHIPYEELPAIFDEIFRVLKPGGLFRLSLPDYRSALLASRVWRDDGGKILFDPGGGGRYVDGCVVDGGHLWFPTYEKVAELFARSRFGSRADIRFLHYTSEQGGTILHPIDYSLGYISRTPDHDGRARACQPLSIVVDAIKF